MGPKKQWHPERRGNMDLPRRHCARPPLSWRRSTARVLRVLRYHPVPWGPWGPHDWWLVVDKPWLAESPPQEFLLDPWFPHEASWSCHVSKSVPQDSHRNHAPPQLSTTSWVLRFFAYLQAISEIFRIPAFSILREVPSYFMLSKGRRNNAWGANIHPSASWNSNKLWYHQTDKCQHSNSAMFKLCLADPINPSHGSAKA